MCLAQARPPRAQISLALSSIILYLYIMRKLLKNSDRMLMLAVYCFIVMAGSFLTVQTTSYFRSNEVAIKPQKSAAPCSVRSSWLQHRHMPAFPKIEINPAALAIRTPFPQVSQSDYLHYVQPFLPSCSYKFFRFLPRDPPSA